MELGQRFQLVRLQEVRVVLSKKKLKPTIISPSILSTFVAGPNKSDLIWAIPTRATSLNSYIFSCNWTLRISTQSSCEITLWSRCCVIIKEILVTCIQASCVVIRKRLLIETSNVFGVSPIIAWFGCKIQSLDTRTSSTICNYWGQNSERSGSKDNSEGGYPTKIVR